MLVRKMWRDIKENKTPFIAIFLMIFLGVFIYTGVNSEWNGMQIQSQDFYQETNLTDVIVYGENFDKSDIDVLINHEGIESVERRAVFNAPVVNEKDKKIELHLLETNTISKIKIVEGVAYEEGIDGVWLDASYAKENGIKISDMFLVEVNNRVIEKEVVGLVWHPEYVYSYTKESIVPDHKNQGFAIMSATMIPNKDSIPFTQLVIKSNDDQIKQIVESTLNRDSFVVLERKDIPSFSVLQDEIKQHQAFGQVFPIVFFMIAVLSTLTTISRLMSNQRLQCGLLKAFGFKTQKIIHHYMTHILFITSLGAICGSISGPLIVPELIYPMMKTLYILPKWQAVPLKSHLAIVIISVGLCMFVAYFVIFKQLKEKPSHLLRPAIRPFKIKERKHHLTIKRLNFYAQWNMRDIFRNKIRSLIAIIGIAGCMGLMICALGMQDSMDDMMDKMFNTMQTYEMKAQINKQASVEEIKSKMQGSALYEGTIELKKDLSTQSVILNVLEDTRYLKLESKQGELIELPTEGIALSYNLAKSFNLKVGDVVTWKMFGQDKWYENRVQAIIRTPISQGITMSKVEYEKMGLTFMASSIVGNKVSLENMSGIDSVHYLQEDVASSMDTMLSGLDMMIGVLIIGAVFLGIIVIYNIGTFSYYEKTREMAILKVLGFKNKEVKKLLYQQNSWLSLIGIVFGIPFGYGLIYTVISTVSDMMDMRIMIDFSTYLLCIVCTFIISTFVMYLVLKKVKQIDMVGTLKSME